jgi:hypothetical protein
LPLVWIYPLGLQICLHLCMKLAHSFSCQKDYLTWHSHPLRTFWSVSGYLLNYWNSPCRNTSSCLSLFVYFLHYRGWPPSSFCFPWSPVLMNFFTSMWKVSNFIVCDQSHVLDLHYSVGQEGCFQIKDLFC